MEDLSDVRKWLMEPMQCLKVRLQYAIPAFWIANDSRADGCMHLALLLAAACCMRASAAMHTVLLLLLMHTTLPASKSSMTHRVRMRVISDCIRNCISA